MNMEKNFNEYLEKLKQYAFSILKKKGSKAYKLEKSITVIIFRTGMNVYECMKVRTVEYVPQTDDLLLNSADHSNDVVSSTLGPLYSEIIEELSSTQYWIGT